VSPYIYTDPSGDYLLATPAADGDGVEVMVTEAKTRTRTMVTIPTARLSDVVAGLYRQAGRPVPVLINPDEVADDWVKVTRTGGAA
jgi:hypothetical protein